MCRRMSWRSLRARKTVSYADAEESGEDEARDEDYVAESDESKIEAESDDESECESDGESGVEPEAVEGVGAGAALGARAATLAALAVHADAIADALGDQITKIISQTKLSLRGLPYWLGNSAISAALLSTTDAGAAPGATLELEVEADDGGPRAVRVARAPVGELLGRSRYAPLLACLADLVHRAVIWVRLRTTRGANSISYHANALLWDGAARVLYHFDPHGRTARTAMVRAALAEWAEAALGAAAKLVMCCGAATHGGPQMRECASATVHTRRTMGRGGKCAAWALLWAHIVKSGAHGGCPVRAAAALEALEPDAAAAMILQYVSFWGAATLRDSATRRGTRAGDGDGWALAQLEARAAVSSSSSSSSSCSSASSSSTAPTEAEAATLTEAMGLLRRLRALYRAARTKRHRERKGAATKRAARATGRGGESTHVINRGLTSKPRKEEAASTASRPKRGATVGLRIVLHFAPDATHTVTMRTKADLSVALGPTVRRAQHKLKGAAAELLDGHYGAADLSGWFTHNGLPLSGELERCSLISLVSLRDWTKSADRTVNLYRAALVPLLPQMASGSKAMLGEELTGLALLGARLPRLEVTIF